MTAAADDEADWVGIKRPGGSTRVIGELAMRPRQDLIDTADRVHVNRAEMLADSELGNDVTYSTGELAALEWALGRRNESPITSQIDVDVADPWNLERERRIATDMLYRRIEMDRRGDGYVVGVEATLMWILNETDTVPY
jgi:hypothetical protein